MSHAVRRGIARDDVLRAEVAKAGGGHVVQGRREGCDLDGRGTGASSQGRRRWWAEAGEGIVRGDEGWFAAWLMLLSCAGAGDGM